MFNEMLDSSSLLSLLQKFISFAKGCILDILAGFPPSKKVSFLSFNISLLEIMKNNLYFTLKYNVKI